MKSSSAHILFCGWRGAETWRSSRAPARPIQHAAFRHASAGLAFPDRSKNLAEELWEDATVRNTALYAQATFKLTDQLSVTGGVRNTWDWQQETGRR